MAFTLSQHIFLFLLFISFLLSAILVCAIFLVRKAKLRHSLRTSLAAGLFLFQFIGILFVVLSTLFPVEGNGPFHQILDTTGILSLLPEMILFTCYILEVKNPCSLTPLNILALFWPLMLSTFYILYFIGRYTGLSSAGELSDNIGNPDVVARLLQNILYICYPVLVLIVRPGNRQESMRPYIILLPILFTVVTVFGIVGFGFRVFPCLYANALILCVLDCLVIRLEMSGAHTEPVPVVPVKENVFELRLSDEMWMDPEMTVEKLSALLGTNRRYLSEAIKNAGYLNYSDMMNSKRVEYICKMISGNPKEAAGHLSVWMYDAGFRSRNTAINAFKNKKGCTPSEYLKSCMK